MSAKKRKYQAGKKPQSRWQPLRYLFGALLLIAVTLGASFIILNFRSEHREIGQYNVSDPFIGEDLYKSLDLKLVARASFPSSPIKVYQTLSPVNGMTRQEFSFAVKDENLTEYGLMLTPATPRPAQGYPVLILLHGYINAARYETDLGYLSEMEEY